MEDSEATWKETLKCNKNPIFLCMLDLEIEVVFSLHLFLTFLILKVFYILLLVCKRALEPFFQCFDIGWSTLDITDDFKPKYLRKGYLCESFNFLRFLGYAS